MKFDAKIVISDIKTYHIMVNNKNYGDRLFEAYQYIKKEKINTLQKFENIDDNLVGLFSYYEITIFDRLKDEEYCNLIKESWSKIHTETEEYIKNPNIGDDLASYGRLGYTPRRIELIKKGFIMSNLTEEEKILREQTIGRMMEQFAKGKISEEETKKQNR